jgi:type IV pilus assembly protein PilW
MDMLKRNRNNYGFTLIELMIAMVIAGIVAAAIMMSFDSQQKTQVNQQLVVEMQQDARAALYLMQQDIRMAGYDETWEDSNNDGVDDNRVGVGDSLDNDCDGDDTDPDEANDIAGIVQAGPHIIQVRQDENGDGQFCGAGDLITYALADGDTMGDVDSDGVVNATMDLRRGILDTTTIPPNIELQPLARSIQAVGFGYAFDYDGGTPDGLVDTDAGGNIIWAFDSNDDGLLDKQLDSNTDGVIDENDTPVNLTTTVPISRIRAVRIWILARTRAPLRDHQYTKTYVVGDKVLNTADDYERVLLTTTVNCRNLGLR